VAPLLLHGNRDVARTRKRLDDQRDTTTGRTAAKGSFCPPAGPSTPCCLAELLILMPTLTDLQSRLEALKAQRDSAVARVSYDGRSVEYRGTAEIARAIADLECELQATQGGTPARQIRIYSSKGL
jgi:hypothetical protein